MISNTDPWILPYSPSPGDAQSLRRLWNRIAVPSQSVRSHIQEQGLSLREKGSDRRLFDASEDVISLVPTLSSIVVGWVGEIYLLEAEANYDISHSEPHWSFRIFVSEPERADIVGVLRLTESIIHEALHLHLTGYEAHCAIVANEARSITSPWRQEPRPYRGVMHGLFVFSSLSVFFQLIVGRVGTAGDEHLLKRLCEIRSEINAIDLDRLLEGLTPSGAGLAKAWREASGCRASKDPKALLM